MDVVAETVLFVVIHITTPESKQIADAQPCMDAHDDEQIVSQLTSFQVIIRHFPKLVGINRFRQPITYDNVYAGDYRDVAIGGGQCQQSGFRRAPGSL